MSLLAQAYYYSLVLSQCGLCTYNPKKGEIKQSSENWHPWEGRPGNTNPIGGRMHTQRERRPI